MSNNDGMTTPIIHSSQDNPRYLSSSLPLRAFSLKEIEENNLDIIVDNDNERINLNTTSQKKRKS
jgi:hypothetical protein